jgi:hypothetical protein
MKSRSARWRRRSATTLTAAVAVLAALVLPAAASASHTAAMGPVTLAAPGCQAKGVWAIPGPKNSQSPLPGLGAGVYYYTVTAIVGSAETTPCTPQVVVSTGSAADNSAVVQWNAVPGATAYKIYRTNPNTQPTPENLHPLAFGQGPPPPIFLTPALVCPPGGNGSGPRCFFQDNGGPSAQGQVAPQFAAPQNTAGSHPDVRVVQCVDYGGAALTGCPNPNPQPADDPASNNAGDSNPPALKTDVIHFPSGFTPNPAAAPACKLSGPAPSLLGDPAKHGTSDPDEDTCSPASLVGTAQTLSRIPSQQGGRLTLTEGDIYIGERKGSEAGRLFIVLRPACSAGSPVAPGSASCQALLGPNPVEVEKEFLASVANFVQRADGSYGIDAATVNAEDDGPLPATLKIIATANGAQVGAVPVQVRQLTQNLFGVASQNTADAGDDKPFINLPTSCGDKNIVADKTTWDDDTVSSAGGPFSETGCEALPFAPKLSGTVGGTGQTAKGAHPDLDVTVTQDASEAPSKSVRVTLPATLGTNLAALGNTCSRAQLDANQCPAASQIGTATAVSPITGALTGPVNLVAQSGALPLLVVRLSGAISIRLEGTIDVSGGARIVNLFSNVPDTPLTRFTLHVNGGSNGLLTNNANLCDGPGTADGAFTAHSGKTATASAPLGLVGACPVTGNAVGTSKRAKVRISLSKLKSGKPVMQVTVTRGSTSIASKLRTVRLTLPKGLKIVKRTKLEDLLAVRAAPDLLPINQLVVKTRLLTLDKIPGGPVDKVTEKFRKRSLRSSGALKRKGKKARPVFRLRVVTYAGKAYSYKVKVKPKS